MQDQVIDIAERRTSADVVFDYLYHEISTLGLMPGDKISEVEIAKKFGVSRQPVRDAFSRLGNLDLLLIRPQKATTVRAFSRATISTARFVRKSVELEVLREAVRQWDGSMQAQFDKNLDEQRRAVEANDAEGFHALDYEFHRLLCEAAECAFAFEVISAHKAKVDRLCVLSLTGKDAMAVLLEDHQRLMAQIGAGDRAGAEATIRTHLSRLDGTIERIYASHTKFFED